MLPVRFLMAGAWCYASAAIVIFAVHCLDYSSVSKAIQMEPAEVEGTSMEGDTSSLVVGLATASSGEEAKRIAEHLVQQHLAACVQIVPGIESVYEWKGTLERTSELLLIIKTRRSLAQDVVDAVKQKHSYEVPEVVFTDIVDGNLSYLQWARAATQRGNKSGRS